MITQNQFILTPYFLDQKQNELNGLAQPEWFINESALPEGDPQSRMSILHKEIARQVERAIKNEQRPVSIAGDCCATIGVLAGLQRAGVTPFLIWLDAHGDFNTWETTPSGFLGGMPLAMLTGMGEQTMPSAVNLDPQPQNRILLTDGRDLDPGERELLAGSQVVHLNTVQELLDYPLPQLPLYVHFDIDVLHLADAPGVSYPAAGGPRATELETIFNFLDQTGQVAATSLSTWNPSLDTEGKSEANSMRLLDILLGNEFSY